MIKNDKSFIGHDIAAYLQLDTTSLLYTLFQKKAL